MPQLTELKIRSIKPSGKIERYHDQKGLYLEVSVAGGKYWRWKYRFDKKEKRLSLGAWPEVSLKEAREKTAENSKILKSGEDPSWRKKESLYSSERSFRSVAEIWHQNMSNVWGSRHASIVKIRLEKHVYPYIGKMPIAKITPRDVLSLLRRIEEQRAFETARRMMGICSLIFRYGVATGDVDSDPCRDLRGALVPYIKGRMAALVKPNEVGGLMRAIDDYKGSAIVKAALLFSAFTFCRPGEIRHAEWSEIDFEAKEWTIPAAKMKMSNEHLVPLSKQALAVLLDLHPLTGSGRFVFPNPRTSARPLSENGVLAALRNMGYEKDQMTAHGFRSMASTLLNELGYRSDIIEAQLAHKSADKIRAIYNRAQYLADRKNLMQEWADYLDTLRLDILPRLKSGDSSGGR